MAIMSDDEVLAAAPWLDDDPDAPPISFLRPAVEQAIKTFLGWGIEEATVTKYYSGKGRPELVLKGVLFVQDTDDLVVKVDQGGAFGQAANAFSQDALTQGSDYALELDGTIGGAEVGRSAVLVKLSASAQGFPSDVFGFRSKALSYRQPAYWPTGRGNIKVTMKYGFSAANMPADIKGAIVQSCTLFSNMWRRGLLVTSEGLGDYNWSGAFQNLSEFLDIRKMLQKGYGDLGV